MLMLPLFLTRLCSFLLPTKNTLLPTIVHVCIKIENSLLT
ncbi:hypothetical protein GLYMA_13G337150v4 [Glycine max]|nr:hypothetical protein GLYMA_13G337150v4 [Glycine max]KAH1104716.1 hypothetical protein GYH30_038198 [Glycine max]